MTRSADNADVWPYDLDYVAVIVPPLDWSPAQNAAWFFLQALNNAFANVGPYLVSFSSERMANPKAALVACRFG